VKWQLLVVCLVLKNKFTENVLRIQVVVEKALLLADIDMAVKELELIKENPIAEKCLIVIHK